MSEEERTGWLEVNRWQTAERSNSANNKVMEQEMPKLLYTFKQCQIDKRYWNRSDTKTLPVKPIHTELLGYCKNSIEYEDMEFPTKNSEDTSVHFASMSTTDSNPTGEDIDRGNAISNTVKAADLDTFSFYDNTENCNLFLSIKGVKMQNGEYSAQKGNLRKETRC